MGNQVEPTGKSWAWRSSVAAAEARNADGASRPTLTNYNNDYYYMINNPKVRCSEGSLFRRFNSPRVRYSDMVNKSFKRIIKSIKPLINSSKRINKSFKRLTKSFKRINKSYLMTYKVVQN